MITHLTSKHRKIYGNCQVLSPDGILMFRCDEKKVNWYLDRNLGEIVSKSPLTIKLNFEPKGLGNHNKMFGLSEMKNKCVVCGQEEFLTKHHIVPYCYRKYFPVEVKSHNFHDVVSMCVDCHDKYERKADELKKELSIKYNAPLNGIIDFNPDLKFKKIAITLLRNNKSIPRKNVKFLQNELKTHFKIKRLTKIKLEKISSINYITIKKSHGEIVMEQIYNLQDFIEMWREHFIKNSNCQYLPEKWNVKNI